MCPSAAIDDFFKQTRTMCFWKETLYNLAISILNSYQGQYLHDYLERMINIGLSCQ